MDVVGPRLDYRTGKQTRPCVQERAVADTNLDVEDVEPDPRLSELSTQWTMLFGAHRGTPEQITEALKLQMLRYQSAVHRYFLKTVGDADAAQELDQEFAVRFLQGNYLRYDPTVGRFRDYVKRAVRNLMIDHHRRKGKTRRLDTELEMAIVDDSTGEDADQDFITAWRSELLDRAWNSLEEFEKRSGQPYYRALRFRATHPELPIGEIAMQLGPTLGQSKTPGAFRQLLLRAREKWVQFLIDEVKLTLKEPTREAIEEELADLRLLYLCKPVLERLDLGDKAAGTKGGSKAR
jgi:RNA polymerase sigma factor (sigma-70 family)